MKGYKAYDHGLVCLGKQYEEGQVFEEPEAVICSRGMHYCDNPMDLMAYHDLIDDRGEMMEITDIEDLAPETTDFKQDGSNKKYCTTKIKIGAKISFGDWVKAAVKSLLKKTSRGGASSGDYSKLAASGDASKLAASGYASKLAASGDYSKLAASGEDCVVAAVGMVSKAKGIIGTWITLAEWRFCKEKKRYVPVCVKTERVDGERIKADTWYTLADGEFKEA